MDGVPLVCTGGGGAIIEGRIRSNPVFRRGASLCPVLSGERSAAPGDRRFDRAALQPERDNAVLAGELDKTIQNELYAHLNYLSFAERAKKQGRDKLANLFLALADSEYRHARNFLHHPTRSGGRAASAPGLHPGGKPLNVTAIIP